MSWIHRLYETYNNCESEIGLMGAEEKRPLLPIYHTTAKAHIEITVNEHGEFINATLVQDEEANTILPCTEESSARTSGVAPHGLCDKLQYVAQDFEKYGGKKSYFSDYISQLTGWVESTNIHFMAQAVYKYVIKGHVINDLVESSIIVLGEDGLPLKKWEGKKEDKPEIFKIMKKAQLDCVVRWRVTKEGVLNTMTWNEKTLYDSWINYQTQKGIDKGLCYVSGNETAIAISHPKYIRHTGDGAKLISANDRTNYTFRGQFIDSTQACQIGTEVSQKAHNALKWLISKQGKKFGDKVILTWATAGAETPSLMEDSVSLAEIYGSDMNENHTADTAEQFAFKFNQYIAGYRSKISNTDNIIVLILDSASPGRLAVLYYRELTGSEFLKRVEKWHTSCCWLHTYKKKENKKMTFWGAPAPKDIVEAIYGTKCDDKLKAATIERLIPCMIDGQPLPKDIVESAIQRAKKCATLEYWEWNKLLSIACALYRKLYEKEGYTVALEKERTSRDYLYGRLLAVAYSIENWALYESGEKRITSAERLMQRFADHPYSTWRTIEMGLSPYKQKLGHRAKRQTDTIKEIMDVFVFEDFTNDKQLKGEFLLGYYCQLKDLEQKKDDNDDESER